MSQDPDPERSAAEGRAASRRRRMRLAVYGEVDLTRAALVAKQFISEHPTGRVGQGRLVIYSNGSHAENVAVWRTPTGTVVVYGCADTPPGDA